jgi:hypothetical protein
MVTSFTRAQSKMLGVTLKLKVMLTLQENLKIFSMVKSDTREKKDFMVDIPVGQIKLNLRDLRFVSTLSHALLFPKLKPGSIRIDRVSKTLPSSLEMVNPSNSSFNRLSNLMLVAQLSLKNGL